MKLIFFEQVGDDYLYWQQTDKQLLQRINALIRVTTPSPLKGSGKPEPLKHAQAGYWSRRINQEHRMVDKVVGESLLIAQLHFRY